MRLLTTLIITAAMALPAAAQYPAATINSSGTPPAASANTTTPATAAAPAIAKSTGIEETPKEEVGYDPKVKRDPYGHIIKDGKTSDAKAASAPSLPNDQQLKNDNSIINKK